MSKRKAGVNDIIYELDNDDIDLSSEDEVKEAKIHRLEALKPSKTLIDEVKTKENNVEVICLDSTAEEDCLLVSPTRTQNGGKTSPDVTATKPSGESKPSVESPKQSKVENTKKINSDYSKTTILNEDIVIDSPVSYSEGIVGCENRAPLVTLRFRDNKVAKIYKEKVKTFMLNLIKLHDEENLTGSETETDLELDIWPEDDQENVKTTEEETNHLFFVDTAPGGLEMITQVPTYRQNSTLISNVPKEPTPPPSFRRGPTCFNCEGAHALRDCMVPKNHMKISERRKNMVKLGRYHVEDDQKYGHLIPGRISGQLRHALGLKRHELPTFIYRMRVLGYPPGWLEEARISHSGITMFDSTGQAIMDPEEEEGEVCEPGSKDKFDIKKILDFPGFNVSPSSRYKEEAHVLGLPPMSEQDSKLSMLQMLAPNAMKAYKRKKLTIFPSASNNNSLQEGQAEMDLDSGDETAEFPSVPPLPDEAPPPAPPPPPPPPPATPPDSDDKSADDLEVIEVIKVTDIPVPEEQLITIDADEEEPSQDSDRKSPTLDDLEQRKKQLLDALLGDVVSASDAGETDPETDNISVNETNVQNTIVDDKEDLPVQQTSTEECDGTPVTSNLTLPSMSSPSVSDLATNAKASEKAGHVKSSELGTPVMNIASSFTKLPTDVKFAKDICDVLNFENLPNSTGKYKQISSLLKKVKGEVDRIQDS